MNAIFCLILIASVAVLTALSPDQVLSSLVAGAGNGLQFALKMFAVYAVWCSVLLLWEKMGLIRFFARKTSKFLRRLFPGEEEPVYGDLALNLSANFLGLGSAGTPAGIRATKSFAAEKHRTLLIVINSTSIQLLPTTVLAIRSTFGATKDIVLPTAISTILSTAIGVLLVKLLVRK